MSSRYEGRQSEVRDLQLPAMEAVANVYADRDYEVTHVAEEFTCVCPVTGQPDFARVTLRFVPDRLLVELKSYKFYLQGFREIGIFHENVVNKILDDFVAVCAPRSAEVVGEFRVRGGIHSVVTARWPFEER